MELETTIMGNEARKQSEQQGTKLTLDMELLREASTMSPSELLGKWYDHFESRPKMEAHANKIREVVKGELAKGSSLPEMLKFPGCPAPAVGQTITRQLIREAADNKFARRRSGSANASVDFRWWAIMLAAVLTHSTQGGFPKDRYLDNTLYTTDLIIRAWDHAGKDLVKKIVAIQGDSLPQSTETAGDVPSQSRQDIYQMMIEAVLTADNKRLRLSAVKARKEGAFSSSHLLVFVEKVTDHVESEDKTTALIEKTEEYLKAAEDKNAPDRDEGSILQEQLELLSQACVSTVDFGDIAMRSRAREVLDLMACLVVADRELKSGELEAMVSAPTG